MFVYNVLNEETLLHQKADGDQDVDGKTLIETTWTNAAIAIKQTFIK
jgi:hypothetical protein